MARAPDTKPSPVPQRSLVARVRRFIREGALIRPGDRVLAGVSGGPDSTCLLLTLAALRRSLGFELHVAHFDHQLRGRRAAEREQRFVRSLCQALAAPLVGGAGDVRAHARDHHLSIEEAARELRYRFLAQAARDAGCAIAAVGHTRDDQAETVLLHILRGSGLRGLAAMAAASAWPAGRGPNTPRLVRPLLALSRDDTEACCRATGLEPVRDPSNRSQAHLRNRIRNGLLPMLRDYNPRIEDALVRLAGAASSDIETLESLAAEALAGEPARDGAVRLDRKRLAALPEALRRHAVRLAVARLLGDARNLSDRHVKAVLRAAEGPTGARLDLARGLSVEVRRATVIISTEQEAPQPLPANEAALPVPGSVSFGPWRVEAKLLRRAPGRLPDDALTAYLDADACGASLSIRKRHPGDRFQPLGLQGAKKLQDFLVDAHVARSERDAVPLVCTERGVAWVVGLRPAEWAKLTPNTRRVLRLRATRTS
jgi:tRNA(Ile)-lysidine synthase